MKSYVAPTKTGSVKYFGKKPSLKQKYYDEEKSPPKKKYLNQSPEHKKTFMNLKELSVNSVLECLSLYEVSSLSKIGNESINSYFYEKISKFQLK